MLIIAGLMAIALLAIIGAVALATGAEKTPAATPQTPTATPTETELVPVQSLPTAQDNAQIAFINGQFHELATQLRALHQQSQEIERRLGMLSQAAEAIKRSQSPTFSIKETEEYRLPEP